MRRDGQVLAFTDHDRRITFEGVTYAPVIMGELSADRREAALRSGDQEARGVIDGTKVTIPDVNGGFYLGAEVFQIITDWQRPWMVFARHRRWVRKVIRRGGEWVATLQGRSQTLQRQGAGRFGGTWTQTCQYKLGGQYCKKDISAWTQIQSQQTGVATNWSGNTLTDSLESWTTNVWQGFRIVIYGGPGSGQERIIESNTSDTVTVSVPWSTNPASGSLYRIGRGQEVASVPEEYSEVIFNSTPWVLPGLGDNWYRDGEIEWTVGDNVGAISAIVGHDDAAYRFRLLLPTKYPIQVGDRGVIRVGCDGLFTTCKSKFANQLNFGGDHEAPSAAQVIEQPGER